MEALEELAHSLRRRLVERAREGSAGPGGVEAQAARVVVDEASPMCDARLPDGSRVNVVVPPLAVDGACMTIRRFRPHGFSLDDLVANGTMPVAVAEFLAECVAGRTALLVSGGTGSGKTT